MNPGEKIIQDAQDLVTPSRSSVIFETSGAANASHHLTVSEKAIHITDGGTAFTVYLPPVSKAAGGIYAIYYETYASTNVTVADAGDDDDFTNVTLTATKDRLLVYSDGIRWYSLEDVST